MDLPAYINSLVISITQANAISASARISSVLALYTHDLP